MLLGFMIIMMIAAYRWGDWANWKQYHPTMLYISACNLLYNSVVNTDGQHLWKYEGDIASHTVLDILYSVVTLPAIALIFLSRYPRESAAKKAIYYGQWIVGSLFVEWIVHEFGSITYHKGWSLVWSASFYVVMYPMLRLHSRKPVLAYVVSVLFVVFYILWFDVSLAH